MSTPSFNITKIQKIIIMQGYPFDRISSSDSMSMNVN